MPQIRAVPASVLCGLLLLGGGTPALAQVGGFEGVVRFKMGGQGGAGGEMVQMYKGGKTRMEFSGSGQSGAMIMDAATGNMTVLMPQQKMYMTMNMLKMGEALKSLPGAHQEKPSAAGPAAAASIKSTGRTETVAGYTCEYYVVGGAQETEMCGAKGLGMFGFGQSPMGGRASSSALAALAANPEYVKLLKDGFFPLKLVKVDKGQRQVVMEATQVEKKSLDASLFVPPPDYKEMKMPGMGQRP